MIKKLILSITLFALSQSSFAYTECSNLTVTHIFNDGGQTYLGFNNPDNQQLNGYLDVDSSQYGELVSIALSARVSDKKVRIRYSDDNLNCSQLPSWNTRIQAIGF